MVKEKNTATKKTHKQQKSNFKADLFKLFTYFVLGFFLLSFIIPVGFAEFYRNKIYPNVIVAGVNLSGNTVDQAMSLLNSQYQNIASYEFHLTYSDKAWVYKASDWGLIVNIPNTVNSAYNIGRDPSIFKNINLLFKLQKESVVVPVEVTLSEDLFKKTLQAISDEVNIPLVEPALVVEKNTISVTSGQEGKKLDEEELKTKIIETISYNKTGIIALPVTILSPSASKKEEEETKQRAEKLFEKKLSIAVGEGNHELEKEELISLISFKGGFDQENIASLAANLASAFDTKPQDAAFKFENGRVTVFKPGKDGQTLNQEKAITILGEELTQLEATTSGTLALSLSVENTPPQISTDEVNDLGIRELLGRGISYFRGSIPSRVHNIILASSKLNGILIKPGETFSFNSAVGDISAATGYQQAYVIQSGRTVLGDGGGVCQVSTTLFRAALNSGLPIVERQAHAYRVAYYEQGFGAGLDATVFAPTVDLKIRNDTSAHILIQTDVDTQTATLTFELFGSSDGRQAFVSKPRIWDQVPPPPPKYEDDPTLTVGTEKQVDFAAWGAKAAFDYKVTRGGETLIDKTFFSNFRPWQAVFLRGTKT